MTIAVPDPPTCRSCECPVLGTDHTRITSSSIIVEYYCRGCLDVIAECDSVDTARQTQLDGLVRDMMDQLVSTVSDLRLPAMKYTPTEPSWEEILDSIHRVYIGLVRDQVREESYAEHVVKECL